MNEAIDQALSAFRVTYYPEYSIDPLPDRNGLHTFWLLDGEGKEKYQCEAHSFGESRTVLLVACYDKVSWRGPQGDHYHCLQVQNGRCTDVMARVVPFEHIVDSFADWVVDGAKMAEYLSDSELARILHSKLEFSFEGEARILASLGNIEDVIESVPWVGLEWNDAAGVFVPEPDDGEDLDEW
ncbi:MAG: hypothetical protein AAGC60_02130 [Acidobacteriota bacterium]